ncbi:uncharacterized protein JCM6883_002655 [Sporobolomyces salmoneus]|uniref:uncharacterized protein n=1 Tax=Sporobolomyces salmoneus TaxID=183962 RepID=UPI0031796202
MVHLHNAAVAAAAVTSVVLSSLAPGAQAAPAMKPLPLRQEARRSMLKSGDMDLEKRDHLRIKDCFDPDHSLHWNYHHGCANEDGHGHGWHGAKERRTIDLEAIIQLNGGKSQNHEEKRSLLGLNLGGNNGLLGNKNNKGLLGSKGGLGLNLRRRAEKDDEESSGDELEKRSPEPRSRRNRYRKNRHRHRHDHDHDHDHDHTHIHIHKRDEIEARDPRHHHHHGHDHDHEHVHVHSHKRDEIAESEELEKRSKDQPKRFERKMKKSKGKKSSSKSAKSYKKGDKKHDSKKNKTKSSKKNKDAAATEEKPTVAAKVSLGKRGLEQAGVPGFVEVATPLFNSSLARTVAGLVFTANPDPSPNATTFVLGTSDAESTQFYLTTASNPDPSTPLELNVVNIRVPILDSQTLKVVDYCATFDLTPPSPLSLLPCGKKDGFSQNFAYNGTTGEIQPLYTNTPAPMALVSNKASQQSAGHSFAATDSNSTASAEAEEDPEDISLYFIPASTYYEAPADVNHLIDSHKNRTLAASMSSADDEMSATATSTSMESEATSTDLPTSTESSSAPDSTMTSAPMDDGSSTSMSSDDYSTMDDGSMMDDGSSSMDDGSMDDSMMTDDSMATPTDSMTMSEDPMATPTDSMMDETLSTSTVEASPSSTPAVNQNNAAAPSSSSSSSSSSMMPSASVSASASGSASASSMTPSATSSGSSMMSSASSTSSSAGASPTVTLESSTTDYTTPGMTSDPNEGIDANASNYSPMKLRRRRFQRW